MWWSEHILKMLTLLGESVFLRFYFTANSRKDKPQTLHAIFQWSAQHVNDVLPGRDGVTISVDYGHPPEHIDAIASKCKYT